MSRASLTRSEVFMGLFSKDAQCAIWPAKARIAAACEQLMAEPDLGVTCCRENIEICRMLPFLRLFRRRMRQLWRDRYPKVTRSIHTGVSS